MLSQGPGNDLKVDGSDSQDRPDFAASTVQFHSYDRSFSGLINEFRFDEDDSKMDALEKVDDLN